MRKRRAKIGNKFHERNMQERGIPLPWVSGIYFQPGELSIISMKSVEHRLSLLLEISFSALLRGRRILFFSALSDTRSFNALLWQQLQYDSPQLSDAQIRELIKDDPPPVRAFRREIMNRFIVFPRENLRRAAMLEIIDRHLEIDSADLCIIDISALAPPPSRRSRSQLLTALAAAAAKIGRRMPCPAAWIFAADGHPDWQKYSAAAPRTVNLSAADPETAARPANQLAPALFVG